MKKKNLKSTLAVAIVAVSATMGYVSYNQYQNQQLTFANQLMEENIEALSMNVDESSGQTVKIRMGRRQEQCYKYLFSKTPCKDENCSFENCGVVTEQFILDHNLYNVQTIRIEDYKTKYRNYHLALPEDTKCDGLTCYRQPNDIGPEHRPNQY